MAELKPAYLIHGDDHGAIGERHARLRALSEASGGAVSVELLEGEDATPAGVALALSTLTFAMGQRVIIVDGVERWKQAEVERQLAPAMSEMPPDTTLALFAREEGRAKAPAGVHKAVKAADGPDRRGVHGQTLGAAGLGPAAGRAHGHRARSGRRPGARGPGRRAPAAAAARA